MRLALVGILSLATACSPGFEPSKTLSSTASTTLGNVTCRADFAPKKAIIHLLSNDEYNNSVSDLLFTSSRGSELGIFEARSPGPSGFTSDSSEFDITDLTISKYWDAAVALAAEVIASKSSATGPYSKIAACAQNQSTVSSSCKDSIITKLGLRAWRRPITMMEKTRLTTIVNSTANFDEGFANLIKAILISPNFLFISLTHPSARQADSVFPLNGYQLASRLSYFLWQSIPDDRLLAMAANNSLNTATLRTEALRMLADPKAKRLTHAMANEWGKLFGFQNLPTPGLNAAVKTAMEQETRMLFDDLLQNDASLASLTTTRSSYLNQPLAEHYGVSFSGSNPANFYKTSLAGTERVGIFGHGSFLVISGGSPTETHPVKRGKAIANDWVCASVPPPPPDVKPTGDLTKLPSNATPRQVLAVHTESLSCRSCHNILDPYGLALETYDPFGKKRSTYASLGRAPIDPSGTLSNGFSFSTTAQMIDYISEHETTKTCLARKVMSLGLGRAMNNADDVCVAKQMAGALMKSDSKFSDVVQAIVATRQFQFQKGEAP